MVAVGTMRAAASAAWQVLQALRGRRDAALAVVNGAFGDALAEQASPLAIPMTLRAAGSVLGLFASSHVIARLGATATILLCLSLASAGLVVVGMVATFAPGLALLFVALATVVDERVSVRTWLATDDELWSVTPQADGSTDISPAPDGAVADLLVWDVTAALEVLVADAERRAS